MLYKLLDIQAFQDVLNLFAMYEFYCSLDVFVSQETPKYLFFKPKKGRQPEGNKTRIMLCQKETKPKKKASRQKEPQHIITIQATTPSIPKCKSFQEFNDRLTKEVKWPCLPLFITNIWDSCMHMHFLNRVFFKTNFKSQSDLYFRMERVYQLTCCLRFPSLHMSIAVYHASYFS